MTAGEKLNMYYQMIYRGDNKSKPSVFFTTGQCSNMCSGHFVAAPDVEAKGTLFTDGDEWSSSRHVGRAAM